VNTLSLHRPSRWPHLLVESGPSIAGIEVGDMLPVDVGQVVYLWAHKWSPFPSMAPSPVSRPALQVRVVDRPFVNSPAWRIVDEPPRVERSETAMVSDSWFVDEPSITSVRGPRGVPVHASKWGLRFVLDGPPLATVRTFGDYVACRPRLVGTVEEGTIARSEWIVASHRARNVLLVDQTFDGALTWRTEPRVAGVHVSLVRYAVPHEHKVLDKEIAAGVVAQMKPTQGETLVGFDGVARPVFPPRGGSSDAREHAFLAMTRETNSGSDANDMNDANALEATRRELAQTPPATIEQIAAVMRSLFPEQAAREAAIVEECAVLAG
jgi:hypothetical protein